MTRINETFKKRRGQERGVFIPFVTAGDPDLATTGLFLIELAAAGADIIELGVPFSDPVADGVVIQRASERALRHGVTLVDVLACAARARTRIATPLVLFSYFNPILQFGLDRFTTEAKQSGIDGVIVTDLIPEEANSWTTRLRQCDLDPIFLVAPTTETARLERIAQQSRGFIYAISRTGVTGMREQLSSTAESLVARIRTISDLPVAVGFGISSREQVEQAWRYADGAVVGSAIVQQIEQLDGTADLVQCVGQFARTLVPGNMPFL